MFYGGNIVEIISNLITAIVVIIAYSLGLRNGQKLQNNEKINIVPDIKETINKVEDIKEHYEEKKDLEQLDKILQNINNYEGSGKGQVNI